MKILQYKNMRRNLDELIKFSKTPNCNTYELKEERGCLVFIDKVKEGKDIVINKNELLESEFIDPEMKEVYSMINNLIVNYLKCSLDSKISLKIIKTKIPLRYARSHFLDEFSCFHQFRNENDLKKRIFTTTPGFFYEVRIE